MRRIRAGQTFQRQMHGLAPLARRNGIKAPRNPRRRFGRGGETVRRVVRRAVRRRAGGKIRRRDAPQTRLVRRGGQPVRAGLRRRTLRVGGRFGLRPCAVGDPANPPDFGECDLPVAVEQAESRLDHAVPAPRRLPRPPRPGENQPILRPGQPDVKQALFLGRGALFGPVPRIGDDFGLARHRAGPPEDQASIRGQQRIARVRRLAHRIRQDDDRRFQPLCAVDGHHPNLARALVHLALEGDIARFDPGDKLVQGRRSLRLKAQRLRQRLVDRILGVRAETRDQAAAAVVANQRPFEEFEGR